MMNWKARPMAAGGRNGRADYDELRRLSELTDAEIDVDPLQAFGRAVNPTTR